MKLYPLLTGWMNLKRKYLIHDEKAMNNPDLMETIPIPAYLIEHPDYGYILFDTGCNPKAMTEWEHFRATDTPVINKENKFIIERLQDIGVNPDDVHTFVMSHLHLDHAGGLYLFNKIEKVYVNQNEIDTDILDYKNKLPLNFHEASDIAHWEKTTIPWFKVPSETKDIKIADGVTIINFGSGHAWGMLGLLINLPNSGNFLLVSDCCYLKENMGPPITLPEIVYDREGYINTMNYIVQLKEKYNAKVIFGHDINQFKESQRNLYWD